MEKEIIITIFIVVLVYCIFMLLVNRPKSKCEKCPVCPQCPKCYKDTNSLDYVFSSENFPSNVHDNIFRGPNVYQGGYNIDKNVYSILLKQ